MSQPDLAPKSNQRPKPVPHVQQGVSQYAWSQVRHPYGLQGEQAGQDHHLGENQKNERVSCMRMHAGSRDPAGSRGSCMVHACQCMRDPGIPGSRARARRVNHAYHPEWFLTLNFSRYLGTRTQKLGVGSNCTRRYLVWPVKA